MLTVVNRKLHDRLYRIVIVNGTVKDYNFTNDRQCYKYKLKNNIPIDGKLGL